MILSSKPLLPKFFRQMWFTDFSVDYIKNLLRRCVRHLAVKSGEHLKISLLTNKRVQTRKESVVSHHLLNCNYSHSFEDFSVLRHENKKYILELTEGLFIMRDRPSMNVCPSLFA